MTPPFTRLTGRGRDVITVHMCDLWAIQGIPAKQLPAGIQTPGGDGFLKRGAWF